ncbi:MAG: hypothetical protein ACI86M_003986, partial [Saprospiraceae bacterium]
VGGEFDIICLCYNIRRSVSILGVKELIERLKANFFEVFKILVAATAMPAQVTKNIFTQFHNIPCTYSSVAFQK